MSEATQYGRRRFIGTAVTAIAGAGLFVFRFAEPERWSRAAIGPIKLTDADTLSARRAEAGPSNGPSVILLHDGPGAIDTDAARLVASGYRVIVPSVVGAAPSDVMALMAGLKIEKALVGGVGESERTAEVMAAQWPARVKGIAHGRSGSGVVTLSANQRPLPPNEELAWWYQYYFLRNGDA
jgi:pimeloyl-ACP methyl ester carboxylesterase